MRSPSEKPSVLRIETPPFVHVTVVDDELRAIAVPPPVDGWIVVAVAPGAYEVSFAAADARHTELVEVASGVARCEVNAPAALEFTSSAPLFGTATTDADQRRDAVRLASSSARSGEGPASLFVFVRNSTAERGATVAAPDPHLSIVLESGRKLDLRSNETQRSEKGLWAGLHVGASEGFARLVIGERGKRKTYEQALELIQGHQTQVFALVPGSGRSGQAIEPGSLSLMISPTARGFDPTSAVQRKTALALRALAVGGWANRLDPETMLGTSLDESPLLGIVGVHLAIQGDVSEGVAGAVTDAVVRLHKNLGPLPDVVALRLAIMLKTGRDPMEGEPLAPLDRLPMLYKSWKRWVQASHDQPRLIADRSIGDRVGLHVMSSGPWLAWRSGVLEGDAGSVRSARTVSECIAGQVLLWASSEAHSSDALYRALRLPRVTAERVAAGGLSLLDRVEKPRAAAAPRPGAPIAKRDDVMVEGGLFDLKPWAGTGVDRQAPPPPFVPPQHASQSTYGSTPGLGGLPAHQSLPGLGLGGRPVFGEPPGLEGSMPNASSNLRRLGVGSLLSGIGVMALLVVILPLGLPLFMAGAGSGPRSGTVTLPRTFEGDQIIVDGELVAVAPGQRVVLSPGEHLIRFGGRDWPVTVASGEVTQFELPGPTDMAIMIPNAPPEEGLPSPMVVPAAQTRCIGEWEDRTRRIVVDSRHEGNCARGRWRPDAVSELLTCHFETDSLVLTSASGTFYRLSCSADTAELRIGERSPVTLHRRVYFPNAIPGRQ